MAVAYKDRHEMLLLPCMGIVLHYTFEKGQAPPPSLSIQRGGQCPIDRSSAELQA